MEFDSNEDELAFFESLFYGDIEKGWNTDKFYCDHCYDEFLEEWPFAYSAEQAKFQCAGIDLDTFYSGSRLYLYFSIEDFRRLIVQLYCSNCRAVLGGNIWPYHLPFNIPDGFESGVEEIFQIAMKAPFLLLTHPLSKKVLELVSHLAGTVSVNVIAQRLYRARAMDSKITRTVSTFDFPPPQYVRDGRYNHAGGSVLYVASSEQTCISEMRDTNCLVMGFQYDRPLRVLDLVDLDSYVGDDQDLLAALCYSALVSAPKDGSNWDKPAYIFTRFLADCATYAGFDAIKYSSTRLGVQSGTFNMVILNRSMSLEGGVRDIGYTTHIADPR